LGSYVWNRGSGVVPLPYIPVGEKFCIPVDDPTSWVGEIDAMESARFIGAGPGMTICGCMYICCMFMLFMFMLFMFMLFMFMFIGVPAKYCWGMPGGY